MSAKPSQYVHKQQCAFCKNDANSDEHVLPQWLDKILTPRKHEDRTFQSKSRTKTDGMSSTVVKQKNGSPRSKRLKVVCVKCNNEWMSVLQDRASSIIIKMIQDVNFLISTKDQAILAAWATMTAMTFEFDDPDTMSILETERLWLRSLRLPPQGEWRIFVGRHSGESWKCRLFHHGYRMFRADKTPLVSETNSQKTIVGIENLDFMIFSTRLENPTVSPFDQSPSEFSKSHGLIQLHPPTGEDIEWHKSKIRPDIEITHIAFEHVGVETLFGELQSLQLQLRYFERTAPIEIDKN
ncbi:hypothetical protein JAB1_14620 [Janthinobacterium sp. MP5059B]|uniref:hypothetical protein n=1 Tax=Janthinobacterium sp. MP5059B TaxID=1766683 RepID=UPI000893CB53|nr:hypothetical protein [Janthinobacterium sp. MP5059B]OEZ50347.1 hypothetical protein JAB1_14620 [Janthinobacterium sp. MP5059B]